MSYEIKTITQTKILENVTTTIVRFSVPNIDVVTYRHGNRLESLLLVVALSSSLLQLSDISP